MLWFLYNLNYILAYIVTANILLNLEAQKIFNCIYKPYLLIC